MYKPIVIDFIMFLKVLLMLTGGYSDILQTIGFYISPEIRRFMVGF